MNRSLVMRSCREDGVLLRPDKPATAIEASWQASFDSLEPIYAWGTFSQVGAARWSYLLGLNLVDALRVPMESLDPAGLGLGWVAYEGWHGVSRQEFTELGPTNSSLVLPECPQITEMALGHSLWVVAPVLPGGWVFLGEEDKLVAASSRRLARWEATASSLQLTLLAAPGESLAVAVLPPGERGTPLTARCVAPADAGAARPNAFGDVDVAVRVECVRTGAVCKCQ